MAIYAVIAKQLWYKDLIQGRRRPDGHLCCDCEAIMV